MKKLLLAIVLAMILPFQVWAAGSCVQSIDAIPNANAVVPTTKVVSFVCTGDIAGGTVGTIPNTAMSATIAAAVRGLFLYTVTAYPTAGGTAPDAADVFILDAAGEDLLGSVDAGTTAKNGLNLIHATLKKTTFPYSTYLQQAYFPAVTGILTLKVSNQITASANYTIELVFVR